MAARCAVAGLHRAYRARDCGAIRVAALSKRSLRSFAVKGVDSIRQDSNVEVVPQTSLQFESAYRGSSEVVSRKPITAE
jgi:uncharacterized protein YunC (DUF1805 family)